MALFCVLATVKISTHFLLLPLCPFSNMASQNTFSCAYYTNTPISISLSRVILKKLKLLCLVSITQTPLDQFIHSFPSSSTLFHLLVSLFIVVYTSSTIDSPKPFDSCFSKTTINHHSFNFYLDFYYPSARSVCPLSNSLLFHDLSYTIYLESRKNSSRR